MGFQKHKVQVALYLTPETHQALLVTAKRERMSMTRLIEYGCDLALANPPMSAALKAHRGK